MAGVKPVIYILDDDKSVLKALKRLVKSVELEAETFASAREFLDSNYKEKPGCLVLDVQMPEMTGVELMEHLVSTGSEMPAIFITAHDDDKTRERAKNTGALAYLPKPFNDQSLINAIQLALSLNSENRIDDKGGDIRDTIK